jgi:hypothetical protein
MRLARPGALVVCLILSGCGASTAPPVHMVGESADLHALAGEWHGTFRNTQMKRGGQVDFKMSATSDSAFGEVVMYTERPSEPIWARSGGANNVGGVNNTASMWQRIRFVRVESGYVSGEMEPMFEPACQCQTVARFLGRLKGSVIEGTFTTRSLDGRFESNGSWRVERTKSATP